MKYILEWNQKLQPRLKKPQFFIYKMPYGQIVLPDLPWKCVAALHNASFIAYAYLICIRCILVSTRTK